MQYKRLINIRPLFVMFVAIMLGILSYAELFKMKTLKYVSTYFVFAVIFFVIALIFIILALVFKHNKLKQVKFGKVINKHIFNFIFFVLFMVIGFFALHIKTNGLLKYNTEYNTQFVQGKVEQNVVNDNYVKLVLKDVVLNNNEKLNATLQVNVFTTNNYMASVRLGDVVQFKAPLTLSPLVTDKVNYSNYANSIKYMSSLSEGEIYVINNQASVLDDIRQSVVDVVNENLNKENAGLVIGSLLGDKSAMDEDVSEAFSLAGISHILAVSGLHVGFLVGFILAVLKLCKVELKHSIIIVGVILLFYSALCNFTPSILRASFMAIILLGSKILGERYDALSSLSLAGLLILLLFPLDLFNAGFQMSFLCVFAIITLAKPVTQLLTKIKCPKFLASALAISICVNLVLIPVTANVFGRVSLVGVVANLIIIPMFSITYPIMFVGVILAVVFNFMSFILIIPDILIHFIKIIAQLFAKINVGYFDLFNCGYLIVFFIILFCLVLKFLMVNNIIKGGICGVLTCIILSIFISNCIPKVYDSFSLHTCFQYSNNSCVITTDENKKLLINFDKYYSEKLLNELKINHIDTFVCTDFSLNQISHYAEIVNKYKVDKMIINYQSYYNEYSLKQLYDITNVVVLNNTLQIDDVGLTYVSDKDRVYGILVTVNNKDLLILNDLTKNQTQKLNNFYLPDIDYLISNTFNTNKQLLNFNINNIIVSNLSAYENNEEILKNILHYKVEI